MQTPGTPPIPHVGGPILPPCAVTVITGGMPQARVGDMAVCVGPPDTIAKGSAGVMVMNMPAARIGDLTVHGGTIVVGFPTVMIGEVGGGGAGGSASMLVGKMGVEGPKGDQGGMADVLIAAGQEGTAFCEQCTNSG
jgi:uncharacterized Zn-binding protein involved in type VI secretion